MNYSISYEQFQSTIENKNMKTWSIKRMERESGGQVTISTIKVDEGKCARVRDQFLCKIIEQHCLASGWFLRNEILMNWLCNKINVN